MEAPHGNSGGDQLLFVQFPSRDTQTLMVSFTTWTVERLVTVISVKILADEQWTMYAQNGATTPQDFRGLMFAGKAFLPRGTTGGQLLCQNRLHTECTVMVLLQPRRDHPTSPELPLSISPVPPVSTATVACEVPSAPRALPRGPSMNDSLGEPLLDYNEEQICIGDLVMIPPVAGVGRIMGIALFNIFHNGIQTVRIRSSDNYSNATPRSLIVCSSDSATLGQDIVMLGPQDSPYRDAFEDLVLCGMQRPLFYNCFVESHLPLKHRLYTGSVPSMGRVTGVVIATGGNASLTLQFPQSTGNFPAFVWRCNHTVDGRLLPGDHLPPIESSEPCPAVAPATDTRGTSPLLSAPEPHCSSEPPALPTAVVDLSSARPTEFSLAPPHTKDEKAAKFPPAILARSLTFYHLQDSCEVNAGPRDSLQKIVHHALALMKHASPTPGCQLTVSLGPKRSSLDAYTGPWDGTFLLHIDPGDVCMEVEVLPAPLPMLDTYAAESECHRLESCTNLYSVLKAMESYSGPALQIVYQNRLAVLNDSPISDHLRHKYEKAYEVIGSDLLRPVYDDAIRAGVPDCATLLTAVESFLPDTSFYCGGIWRHLTRIWKAKQCCTFEVSMPDLGGPVGTITAVLAKLRRHSEAAPSVTFVRAGSLGPDSVDNKVTVAIGFADAEDMGEALRDLATHPQPQRARGYNMQFSPGPSSQGNDIIILSGGQRSTVVGHVTIFRDDCAKNNISRPAVATVSNGYGTSHQPNSACSYWAHADLITNAHQRGGLPGIRAMAIRQANCAPPYTEPVVASTNMQTVSLKTEIEGRKPRLLRHPFGTCQK